MGGWEEGQREQSVGTRRCSRLTTVSLVGSVLTVVLLIAGPAHGDAATAGASEEVYRALQLPLVLKEQKIHIYQVRMLLLQLCFRESVSQNKHIRL